MFNALVTQSLRNRLLAIVAPQLHPPYDPAVSILDLLFMTGPAARAHLCAKS